MLRRRETFTWQKYSYRHFNFDSSNNFRSWVVLHDWAEVFAAEGSNNKTNAYQKTVVDAINRFFPLKTTKHKSTDLPWISKTIVRMITDCKTLFRQEGGIRTAAWKEAKAKTNAKILERKREYLWTQKDHILAEDSNRNFYKHVKNFNTVEKPQEFDVRSLMPGKTDKKVSEVLAEYFNKISQEFDPCNLAKYRVPGTKL